jgi:hypothetical protein
MGPFAGILCWSLALVVTTGLLLGLPSLTQAEDPMPEPQAEAPKPEPQPEGSTTQAQAENAKPETRTEDAKPETRAKDPKTGEPFPERFMIRGGWNYVFNADTNFSLNSPSGIGTTIDFAKNLGGQREDNLWRIDSLYRFNPRHSIGFSYYDVTRKGVRTIDEDITVRDRTFTAGGNVSSELNIKLYRFIYNYSFHHDEKVELAGSFGLYFANIGASLSSNLTCTGGPTCGTGATFTPGNTSSNLTVPLPSIGFLVNYHFTPRLMGTARFDWFYIETAQFKGSMTEAYFGLEYRLFKHFALGSAFDRLNIEADVNPKKGGGFSFENDWNTLFLYGSLYF